MCLSVRHPWEIRLVLVKGVPHPHAAQGSLEIISLFQLELGKVQLHVIQLHHVCTGSLTQQLVSDGLFQLTQPTDVFPAAV